MTVELKTETVQVVEAVVSQQEETFKVVEDVVDVKGVGESKPKAVEKSSSYREESNFPSDLKEHERKALNDFKSKLEEAILGNSLLKKHEEPKDVPKSSKEEGKPKTEEKVETRGKDLKEETENKDKDAENGKEQKNADLVNVQEKCTEGEEEKKPDAVVEVDKDISLWGMPLLPSKGVEGTDILLLKFLRAREFRVNEAFEMLKKTLQWRKESKIDSILDEDLGNDLASAAYMSGVDREGHPICYNIFGVFDNGELYQKTFGTEEKREKFLRWRFQLMEKGIHKLDFKAGGVNSLLQINDLKNSPGPSKRELRVATKQAVSLLQDNYPEFVARNIFINVPFWYYAFHALLSPFLTQRTKSKFVVTRSSKVTETLLKYVTVEEIPIQYGGLKWENDCEFSNEDGGASELIIKAGSTEIIEVPAPDVGSTFIWDLTVLGWEVSYKEEFVPTSEGSYTIIIQKGKKIGSNEGPVRNIFRTNEPGKIVLTIENASSKKKKAFYRYKIKKGSF